MCEGIDNVSLKYYVSCELQGYWLAHILSTKLGIPYHLAVTYVTPRSRWNFATGSLVFITSNAMAPSATVSVSDTPKESSPASKAEHSVPADEEPQSQLSHLSYGPNALTGAAAAL